MNVDCLGHADLDAAYTAIMKETPVRKIEIAITLPGRQRRRLLPTVEPGDIASAAMRIDWWRRTAAVDQTAAEQAEKLLSAIEKAEQ